MLSACFEFLFYLAEFGAQTFPFGFPYRHVLAVIPLAATDVREAKKGEGFRFTLAVLDTVGRREATEPYQACFLPV